MFEAPPKLKSHAEIFYLVIAALFINSLVTSNLIVQKFFSWPPFGPTSELWVGSSPARFRFITHVISKYMAVSGKRVVIAGLFASAYALILNGMIPKANEWNQL